VGQASHPKRFVWENNEEENTEKERENLKPKVSENTGNWAKKKQNFPVQLHSQVLW